MAKNKHLTDIERQEIEHGLRHGLSLKKIAAKIGKHHSTVAREILARRVDSDKGAFGRVTNRCASRKKSSCSRTAHTTRKCGQPSRTICGHAADRQTPAE